MNTLYELAVQQLSKQDHYDFGLRALVSVLKYAGRKKRARPDMPDEEVRKRESKDMHLWCTLYFLIYNMRQCLN